MTSEIDSRDRRVLLVSPYNIEKLPCFGVLFEFIEVLRGIENATVVAPGRAASTLALMRPFAEELTALGDRVGDVARSALRRPARRRGRSSPVTDDYDLCFFACQFPKQIAEIDAVPDWRRRSRLACAFILDTWPSRVDGLRHNYRLLDRFDLVFVLNPASVAAIQRHTSAPVRFLPTAADTLMLPESRHAGARVIDLLSIGRRRPDLHAALVADASRRGHFYLYDVWERNRARDWAAVRQHNADLIARSRAFLVWPPQRAGNAPGRPPELALSTRYFEGWAGGSAILGGAPPAPEYRHLFDWPDSVIGLPDDAETVGPFLDALDGESDRLRRAGHRNRTEALLRHDWAHRWDLVLQALGLPRTDLHAARMADLRHRVAVRESLARLPNVPEPAGALVTGTHFGRSRVPVAGDPAILPSIAAGVGNRPTGS